MRGLDSAGYFHVCTDGRALPWMFKDKSDYIAGINRIGICHLRTNAKVIAYVLMDNHIHLVLYGTMSQCKKFITLYKQLTGTWVYVKYKINYFLKQLPIKIVHLNTEDRVLNTIAYIDRNPMVAGYKLLPTEYPWGSAQYIFKRYTKENTKSLSSIPKRVQRVLLGTRIALPDDWRIDEEGMICPNSFMDISRTESYFRSVARYTFYLSKKLEGIINQELELTQKVFIADLELRKIVTRIIQKDYGKENVEDLDINDRLSVARKLKYNYASTIKQISRMVQLKIEALQEYI